MPYRDREKQLAYMRNYQEEFKRKAKALAADRLKLFEYRALNEWKDKLIQAMVESPTFSKMSMEARARLVRDSYQLIERGVKTMLTDAWPGINKTIEEGWMETEKEILALGLGRRWSKELLEAPPNVQKSSHDAIVADMVKEIEEVKKTKPQPGLI